MQLRNFLTPEFVRYFQKEVPCVAGNYSLTEKKTKFDPHRLIAVRYRGRNAPWFICWFWCDINRLLTTCLLIYFLKNRPSRFQAGDRKRHPNLAFFRFLFGSKLGSSRIFHCHVSNAQFLADVPCSKFHKIWTQQRWQCRHENFPNRILKILPQGVVFPKNSKMSQ